MSMHEYALAVDIIENVLSVADQNQARYVNSITLGLGKLTHVNCDQMQFCLETLIIDTIAREADLIFNEIYPNMECECGFSEKGGYFCASDASMNDIRAFFDLSCPVCGKVLHASGGRDLVIQSIDIEQ